MNWEDAINELKKFRDDGFRNSHRVLIIWDDCLSHFTHKLGDDAWPIYEQVAIAALDCGKDEIALICIKELEKQFRNSKRVQRLQGMFYESNAKYEKAKTIYDRILKDDPTDLMTRKRKIAILKVQQQSSEAIKELNKHLQSFQSDYDSWMELCDLYLCEFDYSKAAFCMEELLLSNPHNHLYHQKYAEIKYTQGNMENVQIARTYFAQAARINPNNIRALYGLYMAAATLNLNSKIKDKKENNKLAVWASEQLKRKQVELKSNVKETTVQGLEDLFDSLQLS